MKGTLILLARLFLTTSLSNCERRFLWKEYWRRNNDDEDLFGIVAKLQSFDNI